jgi:hypothetical protein
MGTKRWKSLHPSSLSEAMELCIDYAGEHRRPVKVLADLMGVEAKTLYRWLSDTSMPLNRIRQFEMFCGVSYISEYLCMARGDRVVIAIPAGKKAGVLELAQVQGAFADAMALMVRFYEHGDSAEETVSALTNTLVQLAYQRSNVMKSSAPELDLFGSAA